MGTPLLELRIRPGGALPARMLSEVDLVGGLLQGKPRGRRIEVDLRHLPVALVLVGEVIERVIEPVLHRQLAGVPGVGGDVGVDAWLLAGAPAPKILLVVAPGMERVPRKVEVVLLAKGPEVRARRG